MKSNAVIGKKAGNYSFREFAVGVSKRVMSVITRP